MRHFLIQEQSVKDLFCCEKKFYYQSINQLFLQQYGSHYKFIFTHKRGSLTDAGGGGGRGGITISMDNTKDYSNN